MFALFKSKLLHHVLLHGPTPPSSGRLSPLVIIPPTSVGNLQSLLKPGISRQPAPVRALVLPYQFSVIQSAYLLPKPRLSDYPPVAEPRLPDYPPVAEPCCRTPPAWLPACCRTPPAWLPACCRTLLPTHRLSDCPHVADPSPVQLPACCRPIVCPTARLLTTHRLVDCQPVADPSPVRLPACCRALACPTTACLAWLVVIPFVQINPTVFSSRLHLPVFSVWVHSSCTLTKMCLSYVCVYYILVY